MGQCDSGPGVITNRGLKKELGEQLLHRTKIHTVADYLHESPIEQAQIQNSYAASGERVQPRQIG